MGMQVFYSSLLKMSTSSVDRWPVDSQNQFSLSKRSTFGKPIAFSEDVIPVANPRRLSRAPRLEEDYRRAQGEGPLSIPKAGTNPPQPVPEPIFPPDQFAVNESMTASYRRRSWTLKPRNGAGPAKPALVTIAEFEEGNELKSGFVSCAASIAYTSPSVSRSTTYTSPITATSQAAENGSGEHAHDTKAPLRSPPPPRTDPGAPPIPKLPDATFNPLPSPTQYLPQSARRQRIYRVNSRSTTPKRTPSKKSHPHPPKEKIITLASAAAARPKLIEIIPAQRSRSRSRGIRNSAPPKLAALGEGAGPYELPGVSSPRAVELPAVVVVVGGGSPTTPTLTFTAPTPTPSPAPEGIPQPTRRAPAPPVVEEEKTERTERTEKEKTEKTVYKPYRAPTPEVAVVVNEKPLPVIPPLKTGRPVGKKAAQDVVVEKKKMEAVEKKEEVKKTVVIPEALRIGMASQSLEARLGNWEALAAGERY
ncbi:uncharacterized protein LAJ45_10570 [Morchella importuna]|uniref:uncharacterized protein n=1 Tax=Morchella importuna TaxID=1174673 RepID=UPI001E8EEFD6|nr:uncharacterized protein LAJ45_10570 [Morchella importuna]KAH8145448.1 hypothetical protein LAJ45_10570 [Morchella importuna]